MKLYFLITLTLVLCGCSQQRNTPENHTAQDIAEVANQMNVLSDLANSGISKDSILRQYVNIFAEGSVIIPPGRKEIFGKDSILSFYENAFRNIQIIGLNYEKPSIMIDDKMAVRRFYGTSIFLVNGQSDTIYSRALEIDILKKDSNNNWEIVWHTWENIN